MLKSKFSGTVQEVVLPDFPDDDNTVTTTVTKSRRVSFGTNFVKEFIVGSAVSAQCMSEYEQAFPSSDSSNADSSHSAAEIGLLDQCKFAVPENLKVHKVASNNGQPVEPEAVENRPKPSKFSRTICFSADSPTADMEFTEGCITLAKSILDKKNKEMTVIIQATPKEPKEEEKPKEDETKYFDSSQFEMSMTNCLKSKENKQEEKRFESEKTKIFSKFEDEMSITRCSKVFNNDESDGSWANFKENLMPLDVIMHHLDKDNSDLENDLFNPKKSFNNFLNSDSFDISNDSEKLNLNESMDISSDFHPNVSNESQKPTSHDDKLKESRLGSSNLSEIIISNDLMEISGDLQSPDLFRVKESPLFLGKPNTDASKEICTDSPSDIHETSQTSVKFEEAVNLAITNKTNGPEKVFSNIAVEIATDTPHGSEVIEISLQFKEKVIEDKLTNLKGHEEVHSVESMEICEEFKTEWKSVQLPEIVKQSSLDEEICNNKLTVLNSFEKKSTNEAMNVSTGFQPDIPKDSEDLLLQGNSSKDDELIQNKKLDEGLNLSEDIQFNTVEASDQLFSPKKIINERAGLNEVNKSTHITTQSDAPEKFETLPPTDQIISNKSVEFSISEKPNASVECDIDGQPENNKEVMHEMENSRCEHLKECEAMEISVTESGACIVAESPLPSEKVAIEEQINDLEKLDSDNTMELIEENQSNAFGTVENPPSTEAAGNVSEPRLNESIMISAESEPNDPEIQQNSSFNDSVKKLEEFNNSNETDEVPTWNGEPSLLDIKVIESLGEQSKEPGCIWSVKDLRYPLGKTSGLLSVNCELLESTTTICFHLKTSHDDRLDSCSNIEKSEINLNEEKQCKLPEYGLVIEFGFQKLKKFFDERRQKLETIRHIPYFLDQMNSFLFKMNSYLRQIHSILTLYPGSRLKDSTISFRLYSFPLFFSSVVSVDLTDLFRLSKSSLSFENDFGTLDECKIRDIFQKCLKNENSFCEFVIQSTNYIFDIEKKSGCVSKRGHIRLLPVELKL